ncbi:transglycosylase SLT domain-containing protein [Roseomonas hellenica]|nr:transglycosylase SLT domain-containing protein [Plastoroseomonas hellenica]
MIKRVSEDARAAAVYFGARWIGICLLIAMLAGCSAAHAGSLFSSRFDPQIRAASALYLPSRPWQEWKAQLYQESRFEPAAVSPVGARGLAQFMPGTWAEVARQLRLPPGASPHQDIAIQAGAYYMARLRASWTAQRPDDDRQRLAQASYNAGLGNILRAQQRCGGVTWGEISPCLASVTGHHAAETIGYVTAIARWRAMLATGG